jgi:hypothetical protein
VVVGDLIGSGASQEQAIIGETPNLAARLQGIAEPNIAESTRKLVGDLFELEDLGAQDLKGTSGLVKAGLRFDRALYPIIGQMERAAAISRDDSLQVKLNKLDAMLAQSSTSAQDAALLAEMLSLPNDGRYPALELTPQQRRQRTLEALVSQIVALSRQNPVLMIFEDAHWSDPTTLELFGPIVDRIPTIRAPSGDQDRNQSTLGALYSCASPLCSGQFSTSDHGSSRFRVS